MYTSGFKVIQTISLALLLILTACSSFVGISPMTPSSEGIVSTKKPLMEASPTFTDLSPTEDINLTDTPQLPAIPSATATHTSTEIPQPSHPLLPAPVIQDVSSVITVENAKNLTRLTSLGEGDSLNMCLSPDESLIVVGTSNGVLIVDSVTFEKLMFLPTAMPAERISFIKEGRELTARDEDEGYVWSFPDGKEVAHVRFRCAEKSDWNCYYNTIPSNDLRYFFTVYEEPGVYRSSDGEKLYAIDKSINSPKISPNGEYIAVATEENAIMLMRFATGELIGTIQETGFLYFSPDGKTLANTSKNKVSFWSIPNLDLLGSVKSYGASGLFYSPDSSLIAVISRSQGTFCIVRAEDYSVITTLSGKNLTFSNDSRVVAVADGYGGVRLYNVNEDRTKLQLVNTITGESYMVFSEDNTKILVDVDRSGKPLDKIVIYDLVSGETVDIGSYPTTSIHDMSSAVWLPSLDTFGILACGSDFDCHPAILDLKTGSVIDFFDLSTKLGKYQEIEFAPNSEYIVSVQGNNYINIWDVTLNGYLPIPFEAKDWEQRNSFPFISISPDSSKIYLSTAFHETYLIDSSNYSSTLLFGNKKYFFPDNGYVGTTDGSDVIIIGPAKNEVNRFSATNISIDYNASRNLLATLSKDGVSIWDLSDIDQENLLFTGVVSDSSRDYYIGDVKFSPDGKYVAAHESLNMYSENVRVWNTSDGTLVLQYGHNYHCDFAFSSDSSMIAVSVAGFEENALFILEISTEAVVYSSERKDCRGMWPQKLTFSPDGKYLAIICGHGFPQIWGIP